MNNLNLNDKAVRAAFTTLMNDPDFNKCDLKYDVGDGGITWNEKQQKLTAYVTHTDFEEELRDWSVVRIISEKEYFNWSAIGWADWNEGLEISAFSFQALSIKLKQAEDEYVSDDEEESDDEEDEGNQPSEDVDGIEDIVAGIVTADKAAFCVAGRDMRFVCVLCQQQRVGYGNNPYPLSEHGKCCDNCNGKVILKRMMEN